MILGAGWAGARAMTSTSGPGISLMSEFAGYGYFAEIPAVIWDIQRMGPSTGLPTRVSQGDVLKTYWLGHGDTKHVVLLPGSVKECFEFGWLAFDIAERLQTPVFVLSDLDFGMNQWMGNPFDYPELPMDRGQQLHREGLITDFLQVRAVPFVKEIGAFIRQHKRCYVVEMNRDGQLHQLLTLEYPDLSTKLVSIAYTDGLPLTARL